PAGFPSVYRQYFVYHFTANYSRSGRGWEATFADGLTSQWNGSTGNTHTLTLTGLAGGYYDFSILGGYYGKNNLCNSITLTISGTGVDMSNTTWATYDIAGARSSSAQGIATYTTTLTNGLANEGYTCDVSTIYVEEGASLTLTLTGDTVDGHRTPLNGLKMTYTVPEPATATLSLLALAGLATRRRRKQA
ncbi:MAG: PEP-CTERM sorting domain-containing protein, partial [Akkermansia sp.]